MKRTLRLGLFVVLASFASLVSWSMVAVPAPAVVASDDDPGDGGDVIPGFSKTGVERGVARLGGDAVA